MATTVHTTFLESKPQNLCLPRHGFIKIVLVLKWRSKQVKIPGMHWKQPECRLDVTFCQQQPRVTLPNHGYRSFKMVNITLNTAGDQYDHLPMSPGGRTGDGFPLLLLRYHIQGRYAQYIRKGLPVSLLPPLW